MVDSESKRARDNKDRERQTDRQPLFNKARIPGFGASQLIANHASSTRNLAMFNVSSRESSNAFESTTYRKAVSIHGLSSHLGALVSEAQCSWC